MKIITIRMKRPDQENKTIEMRWTEQHNTSFLNPEFKMFGFSFLVVLFKIKKEKEKRKAIVCKFNQRTRPPLILLQFAVTFSPDSLSLPTLHIFGDTTSSSYYLMHHSYLEFYVFLSIEISVFVFLFLDN